MVLKWIALVFMALAALDRIFGCKIGLGKELERGILLLGDMALSMVGMIVLSPMIAWLLEPVFEAMNGGIDPSVIPAILFANDMGGAPLATEIANNAAVGGYHALIVSSMMGATVSFTLPFSLGIVKKENHKQLFFGILCGVITVPLGCFVGGVVVRVPFGLLLLNLLPLVIASGALAFCLVKFPNGSVRVFSWLGVGIKALITVGLVMGIFSFMTGIDIPHTAPLFDGVDVIINAMCMMAGMFPLIKLVAELLKKPLKALGGKVGLNEFSVLGFVGTLATSVTTLGTIKDMDEKGGVLNSAFLVSGSWTFAGHLAFTMAFNSAYLLGMILAKLVAAISAVTLAVVLYKKVYKKEERAKDVDEKDVASSGLEGANGL
jgi:ethanolamine transporter